MLSGKRNTGRHNLCSLIAWHDRPVYVTLAPVPWNLQRKVTLAESVNGLCRQNCSVCDHIQQQNMVSHKLMACNTTTPSASPWTSGVGLGGVWGGEIERGKYSRHNGSATKTHQETLQKNSTTKEREHRLQGQLRAEQQ